MESLETQKNKPVKSATCRGKESGRAEKEKKHTSKISHA
jgi:hypothetical protein